MSSITGTQPASSKHSGVKAEVPYSEMPLSFPPRPATAAETQLTLECIYAQIRLVGFHQPNSPIDLSTIIDERGWSRGQTFLLPGGGSLPRRSSLGLASNICNPRLLGAFKDPELNATWLKLAADKNGSEIQSYVLFDNEKSGKGALLKVYSPAQFNLYSAYHSARTSGSFIPDPPIDLSGLIQKQGATTRHTFLLPGGDFLPQGTGLGLREDISNPRLLGAFKDPDLNATWLKLAADKNGSEIQSYVLFDNEKSDKEARLKVYSPAQFNLYSAYHTIRTTGSFIPVSPIDLSELIQKKGATNNTFLLPGGDFLPQGTGLGLKEDISNPRLLGAFIDPDLNATWLKLAADKNGSEIQSYVLFDNEKSDKGALLKVYSPAQFNLYSAYHTARTTGSFTPDHPVDLSELIGQQGATNNTFLLPVGDCLPHGIGVGLVSNISNPRLLEAFKDPDLNATWLKLAADKNGSEIQSYVLLDNEKSGKGALLKVYSPAQFNLYSAYQSARTSGSFIPDPPIDLSELIRIQGGTQKTFLLPGGDCLRYGTGLGLGEATAPKLHEVLLVKEGLYRLHLTGTKPDSEQRSSYLLVNNSGIVAQGKSDIELAQLEKGRCFDRYLAHLVADAKIEGLCAQEYLGSVLTDERFRPNISLTATSAIVHGKWGLDPQDVLDYARRYIRMSRWNKWNGYPGPKESEAAANAPLITFVLARDAKFAEIEQAFQSCKDIFRRPLLLKTAAGWHSDLSKTSLSREIEVEIERIETLAAWGLVEDLKAKRYLPSLSYGSYAVAEESTLNAQSMSERVDKLLSPESIDGLIIDLDTHIETFSPYWEKAYHLELAAHCSYLLDSINESSNEKTRAIAPALKEQLKQRVLKLYPELDSYPGAWKVLLHSELLSSGEAQMGLGVGSAGGGSLVVEFNLKKELEARNAAKQQAPLATGNPSPNTLSLTPREAVLAELGQIKDPIQYTRMLLAATNGRPDKASFLHFAVEGFYRAALATSQNSKLSAALSEIKVSLSRADDFLNLLERLDADASISYQDLSTNSSKAISAAELWFLFSQFG